MTSNKTGGNNVMINMLRCRDIQSQLGTTLQVALLTLVFAFGYGGAVFAAGGDIEWQYRDSKAGKQTATAAALDPVSGELVITGYTDSNGDDFYTVKLEADGSALKWTAPPFDLSGGEDRPAAVVIDSAGDVIVAGHATNSGGNVDFHTVKYNGATGVVIWEKTYNFSGTGDDYAVAMTVDYLNNVYVAGFTPGSNGKDDGLVVKYSPGGARMWPDTSYNNISENDHDRFTAITAGPDGIAVTGKSLTAANGWEMLTVKYDFNGGKIWDTVRVGTFGNDEGVDLAMDAAGDVVVTGTVLNSVANEDLYTVKYNGTNGTVIPGMEMTYADPDNGPDRPRDLVLDANGDIYVTGVTLTVTGMSDFVTIRYNGATGFPTWTSFYSSGGSNSDIPASLTVNNVRVMVTGYTAKDGADDDFTTLKYNKDNGHELWPAAATYNNTVVSKDDVAIYVGRDVNGKVYVAGWSDKSTTATLDYDYYAIRYNPGDLETPTNLKATVVDENTIDLLWTDNSNAPNPNESEFIIERKIGTGGTYVAIDTVGQDITTYRDDEQGVGLAPHTKYYYRVRGYNSALEEYSHYSPEIYAKTTVISMNNDPGWVFRYDGPDSGDDVAMDIAVGPDLDPVVTGFSTISAGFDYYTVKLQHDLIYSDAGSVSLDLNGDGLADIKADFTAPLTADAGVVFDTTLSGAVIPGAHTGDAVGNTTLSAITVPEHNEDKIDRNAIGITLSWDHANSVWTLTDNGGYVDAAILDGYVGQLWDDHYDDPGNSDDMAQCLTVDQNNDVVVSGSSYLFTSGYGATNDVYTRKYPASGPPPFGDPFIWEDQYDGSGGDDYVQAIESVTDGSGNVAVAGYGQNVAGNYDIYVLYYLSDGTRLWADDYDYSGEDDRPVALTIDQEGNIIMTGWVMSGGGYDMITRKYCAVDTSAACVAAGKVAGEVIWTVVHDSGNGDDEPADVTTDSSGDVYVAGFVAGGGNRDTYLVKLASGDGAEVWGAPIIENGPGNGDDRIVAIEMDRNDDEFVAAATWNLGVGNNEFRMTRYTTAGAVIWDDMYDSPATDDKVQAMGMDGSGSICIAGTMGTGGSKDLLAVKYDYAGEILGSTSYDGGHYPPLDEMAAAVTFNRYGEGFVAGNTMNPAGDYDYLVMLCEGYVLQAPAPFTVTPHYLSVDFSWVNNAPAADSFSLEGKVGACPIIDTDTTWQRTFGPTDTGHTETGLAMDQTYCFRLKTSVAASGEDSRWLYRQVTTTVPPAPVNFSAAAVTTTRTQLTWDDVLNGEESFRIERCDDTAANCGTSDLSFTYLGSVPAGGVSFDDPTVCPAQAYTYRIRAVNTLWGEEPLWAYAEATTPGPADPVITSVIPQSEGRIDLAWSDTNGDETGFRIYRCAGPGCTIDPATDSPVALVSAPLDSIVSLKMDESSWTSGSPDVLDSSGNNLDGTSYGDAERGVFDGTDDYVDLGDLDAMDAPGAFSVELRFRRDSETVSATNHNINNVLIAQSSAVTNDNFEIGTDGRYIELYLDTASDVNETKSAELGLAVDGNIQNNIWYHLVFTYDQNAADTFEAKLYLDGALLAQWDDPEGLLSDSASSPLTIGMARPDGEAVTPTGFWGDFNGEIDEVTIYNRALGAAEVADYYGGGNIPTTYSDEFLDANQIYRYLVTAFKATPAACGAGIGWESGAGGYDQGTTLLPGPPVLLSAETDPVDVTTHVNLTWQDNTEFEENFVIERCTGDCTGAFVVNDSFTTGPNPGMGGTVSWTDTEACSGTYTYRVKAVRTTVPVWETPASIDELTASTGSAVAPSALSALRLNEEEIELSWTDSTIDETGFVVERCIGASCIEVTFPPSAGTGMVTAVDSRLIPDTTYDYRVKAVKSAGACSWQTAFTTPQVSADTAIPPISLSAVSPNTTRLDLSWTDTTAHETGFILERCDGDCTATFTVDQTSALDAGVNGYTDTSVCENSQYTYRVRAISQDLPGGMNGCWTKRQKISITPFTPETVVQFTVNHVAGMQADFGDLRFYRFTDGSEAYGEVIPHWFDKKTDGVSAVIWLRTPADGDNLYLYWGNTEALDTSDGTGVFDFFDDFAGTTIDTAEWQENDDAQNEIYQNDGLYLDYKDTSWLSLISKRTFDRAAAPTVYFRWTPLTSSYSQRHWYGGWETDQTSSISVAGFAHSFGPYNNYVNYTHELNVDRGRDYVRYFDINYQYETKVEVVPTGGARSYLRGGYTHTIATYRHLNWDLIKDTTTLTGANLVTTDPLRIGVLQYTSDVLIHSIGVLNASPSLPVVAFDPAVDVACNNLPHVWTSNDSNLITPTVQAAVSPSSFTAEALSESEIKLSWLDETDDETGFLLERCKGNDADCVAVGAPDFDWSLVLPPVAVVTPTVAYLMEEASWPNTAGDVQDSSGNANHGTSYNGAGIVTDPERGLVGEFDGVDDYIQIPNSATLQDLTDGSFTFAAWVNPDTVPPATDPNPPANNYNYTIISRPGWHTGIFYNSNGRFALTVYNDQDQPFSALSSDTYLPGSWHQVVGTVDAVNKQLKLFVDDRLQSSLTYTGTLRDFGTSPYYVGATPGAAYTFHFDGRIDDARIFNYVLTRSVHVDSGLSLSTEYTYRLRAVKDNAACIWDTGDTVRFTESTLAPPKPTNLVATPFDTTRINLVWDDNTTSNTNFAIERSMYNGSSWDAFVPVVTVGPNVESYSDTGVCNGTEYKYRVRAIGEEEGVPWPDDWSDESIPVTTDAMVTPTLDSVTRVSETRIDLDWTDLNDDETALELERCVGVSCQTITVGGGASGYSDVGLNSDTTYCYRMRAVKTGPSCDWQTEYHPVAPLCATTTITTPVISATVTPSDTTRVNLSWTDTTESESAFRIWRCNDDTADCASDANFTEIKNAGPNQRSWSDETVCSGKTYTYKVEAQSDGLPVNGFSNGGGGSWSRRRALAITGFQANQTALVTIPYDSDMLADFADLRFVDADTGLELPYVIDSKTDGVQAKVWFVTGNLNAVNLYYGNPSATSSPSTMAAVMASAEFFDDFQGTAIDSDKWVEIDTAVGQISQNNALLLSSVDNSWNAALISKKTFPRTVGMVLYMQVRPENGPTSDNLMAGWEMNQTTNPSYTQLIYGLFWPNFGNIDVYEKASGRSYIVATPYIANTDYEVKIELKSAGARYYLRGGAYPDWRLIQETTNYTDATLRVAFTQYNHQMKVNMVAVAGPGTMGITLGAEESTPVEVWNSLRSDSDTVITALHSQPVMDQSTTIGVTESSIQVGWNDINPDESWFRIERGDETCANFDEIGQTAGQDIFTYLDTGADLPDGALAYNTTYCYRVQAHKDGAACDWDSGFVSTATATTDIPGPENLIADGVENTRVELTWDDTTSSETGFVIDRCTGDKTFCDGDPDNRYSQLATVGAGIDYYSDTSVCPDTVYSYRVKAVRSGEWVSVPSPSDDATTSGAPTAPGGLALTEVYDQQNDSRRIDLVWTDVNSDETGFRIERCDQTASGDCDTLDTNYSEIGSLLNHDGFTAGIGSMWVQGGRLGLGAWDYTPLVNLSDETGSVAISEAGGTAVLESSSTAGTGVNWNQALLGLADPASLGSGDLDLEFTWVLPAVTLPESASHQHIHTRLQMNMGVDRILLDRAVDEVNGSYYRAEILLNGVMSEQIAVTSDTAGKFRMIRAGASYTLYYWDWQARGWQAILSKAGADPGAVPSFVAIRQFAHQSEAGVSLQAVIDDFRINSEVATIYRDSDNLAASTDYYYQVRAFKETSCPAWDNLYTAKVNELTNPAAPVLTATAGGSRKISLVWTDNAADEEGYEIEKMIFGGQFIKIAEVGPGSVGYIDTTTLDPGATYTYRVRAHRDGHTSYSAYSNEDSATTDVIGGGGLDDTTCR
ncbi:MAG: DUF2341 domain-containing protein [Proteobacteria bacterium]|nr:DUF2341 domain-containing protein [Pseudomonadota bacterium]MBU1737210.1 DUF2341 domain-containing protein [Pseudomonadota bacterium]